MKLWVTSDWHLDNYPGQFAPARPEFDVLVCAGDVSDDIGASIAMVGSVAGDRPVIFVSGNHEYWGDMTIADTLERGYSPAKKWGIAFLECECIDISSGSWGNRWPPGFGIRHDGDVRHQRPTKYQHAQ